LFLFLGIKLDVLSKFNSSPDTIIIFGKVAGIPSEDG